MRSAPRGGGTSTATAPIATDRRFVLAILATCLGFLLVQLDVTIVNVALATMGTDLHAEISGLQWVLLNNPEFLLNH